MPGSTMRAAVHDRYGSPDVVSLRRVERPEPRVDELLVRIVASTVNRTDCGFRAASPPVVRLVAGLRRPRRTILGSDFAGVVEAVGPAVSRFAPGDDVFGFDDSHFGGHAEYRTIGEDRGLALIPAGIGHADAVACVEGAHYAQTYIERARLSEGQSVLIYGATGAIGTAAVQLARARGARVTAVGTAERSGLLRELGAEEVIDHRTDDFTAGERRYELVFDAVGKTSYTAGRRVLADGGMFLSSELGPRLQNSTCRCSPPSPARTGSRSRSRATSAATSSAWPSCSRPARTGR